jgi:hypothetical protein
VVVLGISAAAEFSLRNTRAPQWLNIQTIYEHDPESLTATNTNLILSTNKAAF